MTFEMFAVPLKEIPEKGFYQTPYAEDGLYYPENHAKKLWTGKKIMIVKKRRYPQYEHAGTFILGEYAYGILTLGPPESLPADFVKKEFRKEHLINENEWKKWKFPKGEAKVFVYRPHVLRNFRHPYDYYFPIGTQVIVKDVRLIKPVEDVTHPSGKGEELEPVKESFLEAPRKFIEEYLGVSLEGFVLEQKRAYPETPIEELAKRDFSLWVIQQHLIGEYGKKGERGLKRDNLLDLPIKKGKAHWDFRFQRVDLKTGKALETLEYWDQEELGDINVRGEAFQYFFIDELGRLRFVPETGEEKREYSNRVTLSRKHSRNFRPEFREEIEDRLRKWKARDLGRCEILDAPDDEFKMIFEVRETLAQGGGWYNRNTKTCYLNGTSPLGSKTRREVTGVSTLEHELSHSIFYEEILDYQQKWKEDPDYVRKYEDDPKYREWEKEFNNVGHDITWISRYAEKNPKEAFAESLSFMKNKPALARELMRKNPDTLKPWFEKIMEETGYKLRKVRKD